MTDRAGALRGYFGDKPEWQRVTYKPITNDASRVAAVLSGDVDLISNVPGNDAVALKDNPKITLGTMESNRCYFWTLDVDRDRGRRSPTPTASR